MRLVRRLVPGDKPALLDHLLGLSQVDRRLRFCGVATDSLLRRYCAQVDWKRSILLGCFAFDRLVGVLHLLWVYEGSPDVVEFALSVERDHQGSGVGGALAARAMMVARTHGVRTLRFVCLPENEAMQRLALRLGARLVTDGEEVDGIIDVPAVEPPDIDAREPQRALSSGVA